MTTEIDSPTTRSPLRQGPSAAGLHRLLDCWIAATPRTRLSRLLRDPIGTFRRKLAPHRVAPIRTFWGGTLYGVPSELVARTIMSRGMHEEPLTRSMFELLTEGMTFVDVGAHIGYYSLLGAYLVGRSGHVVAFEPTPSTFKLLSRAADGHPQIIARQCAAWDSAGTLTMRDHGPGNSAFNSFTLPRRRLPRAKEIQVRCARLDDELLGERCRPDVIKVDAESAEWQVLSGMERILAEVRPIVTLELGDVGVPGVATAEQVLARMRASGYRPLEWRDGALRPIPEPIERACVNVVFVPTERGDFL